MQADVEQLQLKAASASGNDTDDSCCTEGSSGSAVPEDAGIVLAGQLQQQLAKLTQNCAELGEAVLQLELQLEQVRQPWPSCCAGPVCARNMDEGCRGGCIPVASARATSHTLAIEKSLAEHGIMCRGMPGC
jgi:hypothetical protein